MRIGERWLHLMQLIDTKAIVRFNMTFSHFNAACFVNEQIHFCSGWSWRVANSDRMDPGYQEQNEKNAQKDNFSQYCSKDSTLDRIQPTAQSPAENSQETNLYSTIMPACSHINSYEHSPQLPSRSHNSNTVV